MNTNRFFSSRAAIAVVVANMIGTGVFTSLGFQLVSIQSGFVILALWVAGGIAALCGALTYAELGAALPRSGGEYNFLSRLYHPVIGFLAGWISATVGFAAPIALAALAFGAYATSVFDQLPAYTEQALASGLILIATLFHTGSRSASGGMQQLFTAIKVIVIIGFSAAVPL